MIFDRSSVTILIVETFFVFIIFSCRNVEKPNSLKVPYERLCTDFLNSLYDKRIDKATFCMDEKFLNSIERRKLDSVMSELSDQFNEKYGGPITIKPITSEKTYDSNIPVTFIVFKIESASKFGYEYFYVNEQAEKILRVAEFGKIKEKR